MKIDEIINFIESSQDFFNIRIKYPKTFLYAIFYIFEKEDVIYEFDYYLNKKEVAIFSIKRNKIEVKISKIITNKKIKKPLKLKKVYLNFDDIKKIIYDEIKKRNIKCYIEKIILILSNEENKNVWKINCITKSLEIINIEVLDKDGKVNKFDKRSLFDFVKFKKNE